MDLSSFISLFVTLILTLFLGKILSVAGRVLFYTLIFFFLLVLVFGFSYSEVVGWITKVLFWVL
ncbi:hypothetical protein HYS49_00395 [Candidatus Woesearchaeota archaeon]|nr:hypothetical protein [Candidatus Woesearchaeota archaeon]